MAAMAEGLGVPAMALVRERFARSTRENAALSRPLVGGRIVLVSDSWHLPRARRLFLEHFEVVEVHPVRGSLSSRAKGWAREGAVRLLSSLRRGSPGAR